MTIVVLRIKVCRVVGEDVTKVQLSFNIIGDFNVYVFILVVF